MLQLAYESTLIMCVVLLIKRVDLQASFCIQCVDLGLYDILVESLRK